MLLDPSGWPKSLALWQWTILSRRCLLKLHKKDLIFSPKRLTLSSGNFGLPATKLMRFFSKRHEFETSFFLVA